MGAFRRSSRNPQPQQVDPVPTAVVTDSDGDGISDAEERLAVSGQRGRGAPQVVDPPVLETTLPPLGTATVAPVELPTVSPVASPTSPLVTEIASVAPAPATSVTDLTLTQTLGANPAAEALIGDGFAVQTGAGVLEEAQAFGGTSATVATGGTYETGVDLNPRTGLISADGDGTTRKANADGSITTTIIQTTQSELGTTKTTQVTTEKGDEKVVVTTVETNEPDGDSSKIVTTDTYGENEYGATVVKTSVTTASGTEDGQEFEWWRENTAPASYDTGEGDMTANAELSPVMAQIVGGTNPTNTTPTGPDPDDGGTDPITADVIAGGATVVGVIVNPRVIDDGYEVDVVGAGDPTNALIVGGPDGVNPLDPDFAGGEPVTADDLTSPQPTNANPTSSSNPLTGDTSAGAFSGVSAAGSGTIASTGGEDEDLEDLEIQRVSPRGSTTSTTVENDPILGGVEPISAGDLRQPLGGMNPVAGGEDEDLEDLEIQRLTPRAGLVSTTVENDPILGGVEPISAGDLRPPLGGMDPQAMIIPEAPTFDDAPLPIQGVTQPGGVLPDDDGLDDL